MSGCASQEGRGMFLRRFGYCQNESGAVTVFIVVMFSFLLTFGGLIFDIARIFNLHSQSQAYVDGVALAAAAELDGKSGALQRAIRAAVGDEQRGALLSPGSMFSFTADKAVNVESVVFLESIDDDPAPGTRSPVADDVKLCTYEEGALACEAGITQAQADARAHFVLVTTTTETEKFILFPIASAFIPDIQKEASVNPQALAGFKRQVCNYPPLAICNPYESPTGGGDFNATVGQQIMLRAAGSSGSWAPGNFGLLDLTGIGSNVCTGGGANYLRCMLAVMNPNTYCTSATVDTQPGLAASVDVGFNVRFDIFDSPFQNNNTDANYAASANVTRGKKHSTTPLKCKSADLDNPPVGSLTVPLPRDPCFGTGTCATNAGGARFGNGVTTAQLQSYWTSNHGGTLPTGLTTRYDVYRYEINNNVIPNKSSTGGENGNATCATTKVSDAGLDRRLLTVAIVNCIENDVHGAASDLPAVAFARMFMTEYIAARTSDLYAEVIGVATPDSNDVVLHEYPVLYR